MKHSIRRKIEQLFITAIFIISISIWSDESNTSSINTSPINEYEKILIRTTKERIEQLNNTILLENKPSVIPPAIDTTKYFLSPEQKYTSPLKTDIPEFKEKSLQLNESNIQTTFEEIFSISSPEKRILLCKKIITTDINKATEKIIYYLAYGSPEEALIIDSILPDIKSDIEKNLLESFQNYTLPIQERKAIAYALGKIKSTEAIQFLWDEAHTTPNYDMQYTCIQALANMPHSLSLEQWSEFVQNSSPSISLIACKAIFDYGGVESERYIRKILLREIQTPRNTMEYALSKISNYPLNILVPFLIEVMEKNPDLAMDSANILKQKTGMNFGPAPQLWAKWWEEINTPPPDTPTENAENIPPHQPDFKVIAPKIRRR